MLVKRVCGEGEVVTVMGGGVVSVVGTTGVVSVILLGSGVRSIMICCMIMRMNRVGMNIMISSSLVSDI